MRISDHVSVVMVPVFLLVTGALHTGASVMRELVDDHGRVVMDADGQPVLVEAAWETWKMNWLPNVLFLMAAALLAGMFWQEVVARHFKQRALAHGPGGQERKSGFPLGAPWAR